MIESDAPTKLLMDYYGIERTTGFEKGAHLVLNSLQLYDETLSYDARDFVVKIQERLLYMPSQNLTAFWLFNEMSKFYDYSKICKRLRRDYDNLLQSRQILLYLLPGARVLDHVRKFTVIDTVIHLIEQLFYIKFYKR